MKVFGPATSIIAAARLGCGLVLMQSGIPICGAVALCKTVAASGADMPRVEIPHDILQEIADRPERLSQKGWQYLEHDSAHTLASS